MKCVGVHAIVHLGVQNGGRVSGSANATEVILG